jgi:hypothetical protein
MFFARRTTRTCGYAAATADAVPSSDPLSTRITGAWWYGSERSSASRRL